MKATPIYYGAIQTVFLGIVLSFSQSLHGQSIEVSEKSVKRIFRENMRGTTHYNPKRKVDRGTARNHKWKYSEWLVCNYDNSYYSKDTLVLHNHMYAYFEMHCGQYIGWCLSNHKNKKSFYLTSLDTQEPPRQGTVLYHCYAFPKIHKKNSEIFITLKDPCFNQDEFKVRWDDVDHVIRRDSNATRHETEVFKVIDLHRTLHRGIEGDWKYVMTIVRQCGK